MSLQLLTGNCPSFLPATSVGLLRGCCTRVAAGRWSGWGWKRKTNVSIDSHFFLHFHRLCTLSVFKYCISIENKISRFCCCAFSSVFFYLVFLCLAYTVRFLMQTTLLVPGCLVALSNFFP